MQNIGEIIRKSESDYISGTTNISKHVQHSMLNTLERIDAYLFSKHISGETDSLGRDKPFFNIATSAVNVWYRATDIDRSHILVKAVKSKDWIDSFLATIHLRDWMRREFFGQFLNEWGRSLARYGSSVVKFTKNSKGLHIQVIPWNRLIVDAVDFDSNLKIEILELTEAQLRERIKTNGYDKGQVEALTSSLKARETANKQKKDTKSNYIKLYELHGVLPLSYLTEKDKDENTFVQQMHVVSFVGIQKGRKTEYEDFSLYSGKEEKDPYMLTQLIKEDGRTLSIGAVEHLFEAQWMVNHSMKAIKDNLDLASRLIFQTSDPQFLGRNVLNNIETGDILIHSPNQPLTQLNNQSINVTSQQNFAVQWKQLGNEITGVSEAMLGATPKSGTAWRQTEAILQESHSLFELMIENKALMLEEMLRVWILPYLKTKMDTSKEVSATLSQYEIDKIDARFIKNASIKMTKQTLKNKVLNGEEIMPGEKEALMSQNQQNIQDTLQDFGNQRFFKPDEISDKTWKEQFKDLEWEVEIDISGESFNSQAALTTLSTALKLVTTPGFEQNKKAQMIVGKVLELTGTFSPMEYNALPAQQLPTSAGTPVETPDVSTGVLPA